MKGGGGIKTDDTLENGEVNAMAKGGKGCRES